MSQAFKDKQIKELRRALKRAYRALLAMPEAPEHIVGDDQYTDYCTGADGTRKQPYQRQRNRQCSIGWHGECSDPAGEECGCPCHWIDEDLVAGKEARP